MGKFVINGGKKLSGIVEVGGAKNSALKLMAAALLATGKTTLKKVPHIEDVNTMALVLRTLGAQVDWESAKQRITIAR